MHRLCGHGRGGAAFQLTREHVSRVLWPPMCWTVSLRPTRRTKNGWLTSPNIWTAEGWLYVAAVLDLFSRRVVGWSMSATMTAQLVTDALVMAIWRRGKPHALQHHSDRGSQYTAEPFQKLMAENGVTCSMSRSGNVWDNAVMESFFSSLKTERIARKVYRTRDRPGPMCSIMSSASTTRPGATRPLAMSALWNSRGSPRQLKDSVHQTGCSSNPGFRL